MYTTPSANGFVRKGYSAKDANDDYIVGHKQWTTTGNCAAGLNHDGTGCHSGIQAKYPDIDISQVPEYTNRIACTACHDQHASDYPRMVRLPEDSKGDLIVLVGEVNLALGSTIRTGAILKAGTTATSDFDKTYIGGTWTGSGLYTLTANRTLAANRILDNTKLTTVVAGSSIRSSTILKVGTIAASVTDTTNLGGTWTGTGPYTLGADWTLATVVNEGMCLHCHNGSITQ
jgi:formate-dependent nitrite reductase cytochrome c552 subunit